VLIVPGRQRSKAQRLLRSANLEADWSTPPSAEVVLARDEERLMSDPAWAHPLSSEERAFAERLLKVHSAEKIAAAYLRLYRDRNSAPEILDDIPETGTRKKREPAAFGPSTWFSLSLGRKQRAEPRWLLPMLCRNSGLSKDAIGAIRVQYQETFIEILTAAVPAMKTELGPELEVQQGARFTELPGIPDFDASPKGAPATPKAPQEASRQDGEADTSSLSIGHAEELKHAESGQTKRRKGKPDARQDNSAKHKADKPKRGKPDQRQSKSQGTKDKGQYVKSAVQEHKKRKNAADPSKPLGPRRERDKGRQDGNKPKRLTARAAKGPDARPTRKPPPKP